MFTMPLACNAGFLYQPAKVHLRSCRRCQRDERAPVQLQSNVPYPCNSHHDFSVFDVSTKAFFLESALHAPIEIFSALAEMFEDMLIKI